MPFPEAGPETACSWKPHLGFNLVASGRLASRLELYNWLMKRVFRGRGSSGTLFRTRRMAGRCRLCATRH